MRTNCAKQASPTPFSLFDHYSLFFNVSSQKKHHMTFEKCQENIFFSVPLQFADMGYIHTPSPAQSSVSETSRAQMPLSALLGVPCTPPDLLWLLNVSVGVSLMNSIAPSVWLPLLDLLRVREEQQANASPILLSDSQSTTAATSVLSALLFLLSRMTQMHCFSEIIQKCWKLKCVEYK